MATTQSRLTGGHRGYRAAVKEAFQEPGIVNPTLYYSERKGFFVESGIHPPDDDAYCIGEAHYESDSKGRWSPWPSGTLADYDRTRHAVMAWLAVRAGGGSRLAANEAAEEAEYAWDCDRYDT